LARLEFAGWPRDLLGIMLTGAHRGHWAAMHAWLGARSQKPVLPTEAQHGSGVFAQNESPGEESVDAGTCSSESPWQDTKVQDLHKLLQCHVPKVTGEMLSSKPLSDQKSLEQTCHRPDNPGSSRASQNAATLSHHSILPAAQLRRLQREDAPSPKKLVEVCLQMLERSAGQRLRTSTSAMSLHSQTTSHASRSQMAARTSAGSNASSSLARAVAYGRKQTSKGRRPRSGSASSALSTKASRCQSKDSSFAGLHSVCRTVRSQRTSEQVKKDFLHSARSQRTREAQHANLNGVDENSMSLATNHGANQ